MTEPLGYATIYCTREVQRRESMEGVVSYFPEIVPSENAGQATMVKPPYDAADPVLNQVSKCPPWKCVGIIRFDFGYVIAVYMVHIPYQLPPHEVTLMRVAARLDRRNVDIEGTHNPFPELQRCAKENGFHVEGMSAKDGPWVRLIEDVIEMLDGKQSQQRWQV
jgi:hypothetical protein